MYTRTSRGKPKSGDLFFAMSQMESKHLCRKAHALARASHPAILCLSWFYFIILWWN